MIRTCGEHHQFGRHVFVDAKVKFLEFLRPRFLPVNAGEVKSIVGTLNGDNAIILNQSFSPGLETK